MNIYKALTLGYKIICHSDLLDELILEKKFNSGKVIRLTCCAITNSIIQIHNFKRV